MSEIGLVDSHIHLTDYESGTDISAVIAEGAKAGVSHLVCNGTCERDWPLVAELARMHSGVVPFFGLHPWFVNGRSPDWLAVLEKLVGSNRCGVGEAGLDRMIEGRDPVVQEEVFRSQLRLAHRLERPIAVHCVRAWGWLMDVLASEEAIPRMLIHAFGGAADLVGPLAGMGAYFSFSATVLNPSHRRAAAALAAVPRNRLLVETDAPNMLPVEPYQRSVVPATNGGVHNHPANLPMIVEGIAAMLGEPVESLKARLWENSARFFGTQLEGHR